LVAEYRSIEEQINSLIKHLEQLKEDPSFQVEAEFEDKLRRLMGEYGKSLRDIILIIDPDSQNRKEEKRAPKRLRGPRKVNVYKNPHTGEILKSAGGNHKVLKQWKLDHPNEDLKSWIIEE
jgi:hypothetical protein